MDLFDQFFRGRLVRIERNGRYDPARMIYGPRVRLAALAIPERRRRPPSPPPPRRPIIYDDYNTDYDSDSDFSDYGSDAGSYYDYDPPRGGPRRPCNCRYCRPLRSYCRPRATFNNFISIL